MGERVIELSKISKVYSRGAEEVQALRAVDLSVGRGEFVALVGRSGSGKSTLMNIIGCLDRPTQGEYSLCGERVLGLSERAVCDLRRRKLGFIFQSFHLIDSLSALENVELPLLYQRVPAHLRRLMAVEALSRVGLSGRFSHRPQQLSGGQQQRVAVARSLVAAPEIILADEPTGNLDSQSGAAVIALLESLHREGRTILLITHDRALAQRLPRMVSVEDGQIVE